MKLGKIRAFLYLHGKEIKDNIYILIAKVLFLFYKLSFRKGKGIGDFLFQNVIAKTSYGLFYCRGKNADLSVICESTENDTLKIFKPKKRRNSY